MRYLSGSAAYAAWEKKQEEQQAEHEKNWHVLQSSEGHPIARSAMAPEPTQSVAIYPPSPKPSVRPAAQQLEFKFMS